MASGTLTVGSVETNLDGQNQVGAKTVKIALGLPWYNGADRDCIANMLAFQHYLGRLQERLNWIDGRDYRQVMAENHPKLDPANTTGGSEIPHSLINTKFEFGISEEVGCSLPGLARERIVDCSIKWGADYILFYDDDMLFGTDLFLKLYLAQKPVVAALAFTARKPITPVIYKFEKRYDEEQEHEVTDIQPVFEYERGVLQQVDAVGTGVMLIDTSVFKKLKKPWFHSPGLGEDIYFCYQCKTHDIPIYVHAGAQTLHKPAFADEWHSEKTYLEQYERIKNGTQVHP